MRRNRFVQPGTSRKQRSPLRPLTASWLSLGLIAAIAPILGACTFGTYAGINLAPDAAPRDLRQLASRARQGNADARFALARLYEGGLGVSRNVTCAARLYAAAASGPNPHPDAQLNLERLEPLLPQGEDAEREGHWCGDVS